MTKLSFLRDGDALHGMSEQSLYALYNILGRMRTALL